MSAIDEINNANTHNDLNTIVNHYLVRIGAADAQTQGETYEETAERLDDDVMRAAASRWWEIEEGTL